MGDSPKGVTSPGKVPPPTRSWFRRFFNDDLPADIMAELDKMTTNSAVEQKMKNDLQEASIRRVQAQMGQYQEALMAQGYNQAAGSLGNMLGGSLGNMQNAQQAAMGMGMNSAQMPYQPMEKLCMRLNIPRNGTHEFDFMHAVDNPAKENVVVFLIVGGEPITLEDERAMFPSDGLIARINVLRK